MGKVNRQLLVVYSRVFGEEPPDVCQSLSTVNKNTWAKIIARLNHLARTRKDYSPAAMFTEWFNKDNHEAANEIWDKLRAAYTKLGVNIQQLVILNMWSNLTLFDKVLESNSDPKSFLNNSEAEVLVLKLYLATNEESTIRTDSIFGQISEADYPNQFLIRQLSYNKVTGTELSRDAVFRTISDKGNNFAVVPVNEDGSIDVKIKGSQMLDVNIDEISTDDELNINVEKVDGYSIRGRIPVRTN